MSSPFASARRPGRPSGAAPGCVLSNGAVTGGSLPATGGHPARSLSLRPCSDLTVDCLVVRFQGNMKRKLKGTQGSAAAASLAFCCALCLPWDDRQAPRGREALAAELPSLRPPRGCEATVRLSLRPPGAADGRCAWLLRSHGAPTGQRLLGFKATGQQRRVTLGGPAPWAGPRESPGWRTGRDRPAASEQRGRGRVPDTRVGVCDRAEETVTAALQDEGEPWKGALGAVEKFLEIKGSFQPRLAVLSNPQGSPDSGREKIKRRTEQTDSPHGRDGRDGRPQTPASEQGASGEGEPVTAEADEAALPRRARAPGAEGMRQKCFRARRLHLP